MTTQEIVSKLWNLCNVLRDDGITYHQYVTELTYILFLKMAKETAAELPWAHLEINYYLREAFAMVKALVFPRVRI